MVILIMFENIVIFMVWCILELVLVDIVIGSIFMMKVMDVISIGWRCKWFVFLMVESVFIFLFCSFFVNLIIRMVFFVVRLISIIKFIWVKILLLLL